MEPSLDLQKAIRARLVAAGAVTALVPASSILDSSGIPRTFPCILLGEAQTLPDDGLARNRHEVHADLHIWQTEDGTVGSKQIAGAIRDALAYGRWTLDHYHVADLYVASTRFMRDPDGLHSHAVMTLSARLVELA
jgi:hypothetical protein